MSFHLLPRAKDYVEQTSYTTHSSLIIKYECVMYEGKNLVQMFRAWCPKHLHQIFPSEILVAFLSIRVHGTFMMLWVLVQSDYVSGLQPIHPGEKNHSLQILYKSWALVENAATLSNSHCSLGWITPRCGVLDWTVFRCLITDYADKADKSERFSVHSLDVFDYKQCFEGLCTQSLITSLQISGKTAKYRNELILSNAGNWFCRLRP